MKYKIKGLEDYEVEAISFPLEEAPEGSTEETSILIPVVILPKGRESEKQGIVDILMQKKLALQEKMGSKLLKVIVKPRAK